jgi:VanZ family protein
MKLIKHLLAANKYSFVAVLIWILFITYMCIKTIKVHASIFKNLDKIVHFTFYFILIFLIFRHLIFIKKTQKKHQILMVLFAIFFGIAIEWAQYYFTTTRKADFFDVIANSLGAISGMILSNYLFVKFVQLKH